MGCSDEASKDSSGVPNCHVCVTATTTKHEACPLFSPSWHREARPVTVAGPAVQVLYSQNQGRYLRLLGVAPMEAHAGGA